MNRVATAMLASRPVSSKYLPPASARGAAKARPSPRYSPELDEQLDTMIVRPPTIARYDDLKLHHAVR